MDDRKVLNNFFDGAPVTKRMLIIFGLIAVCIVFEQADNFNFAVVAPTLVKNWHLTVQQIGNINSAYMIGMIVGTFIGGICSDGLGRKKTIIGATIFFSVASILNGFAQTYAMFMLCRFLTAAGVAAVVVISGPYLIEMLPSDKRGRYSGLAMGFGFLGMPAIAIFANLVIPMGQEAWRTVYMVGGLGLIVALLGVKYLEETPRWLLTKGKLKQAEQVVETIAGSGFKADLSQVPIQQDKFSLKEVVSLMFGRKLIKNTFVLFVMFGLVLPAGLVFGNLSPTILIDRGFSIQQGLKLSSFLALGLAVGPFIAALIAEWGGRKIPLVLVEVLNGTFCIIYGFMGNFPLMLLFASLAIGIGEAGVVLSITYSGELYPKIRNAAVGVASSIGRVMGVGIMLAAPVVYRSYGVVGLYTCVGSVILISALIVAIFGIRTGGITLEDLTEKTEEAA